MNRRTDVFKNVKRVVIKIGSRIIASKGAGLNKSRIERLANEIFHLKEKGFEIVLVSSGAILAGMEKLGLKERPKTIPLKQAAAAVGQSQLMWLYEKTFKEHNLHVAQILLTGEDLADRKRFLNSRNTFFTLFDHKVIPIVNENDTVSIDEIKFGDNDHLAALVTNLIDGQLLIILTDVDGLFTADPRTNPHAELLSEVDEISEKIEKSALGSGTLEGTGGMRSKIEAAKKVGAYGVPTLLLNGTHPGILSLAFGGEAVGTLFRVKGEKLNSRKHWIAFSIRSKGELYLDEGAATALVQKGKSLLPSGITSVKGIFMAGDAVTCIDPNGKEIAKGLVNYPTPEINQIKGIKTTQIEKVLGYKFSDEVIHRNNLVIL
ncbi:MAG: glutamate 5-kinase [Nitrospirae bacterium]|nr:glutamate 5-kinase [Nitrospirota bacterium]MBI3351367.1 glutamate 5-kinase [Nitrospirota bacterium]